MDRESDIPSMEKMDDTVIRSILEGTASHTGERFFEELVKNLSKALQVKGAWVTEYLESEYRLRARAFWLDHNFIREYEYDITGTPCEPVIQNRQFFFVPERVIRLFPDDPDLPRLNAVSYMGAPLLDNQNNIIGHLAVLDSAPLKNDPRNFAILKIFAARASAEVQRIKAEQEVLQREEKLNRLLNSAMDAIIEADENLLINQANTAFRDVFNHKGENPAGRNLNSFFSAKSVRKLKDLMKKLREESPDKTCRWIAGGLEAVRNNTHKFSVEGTLSTFSMDGKQFFTLILRDVSQRIEAEEKIQSLTAQADYFKEELKTIHNFDEIIGNSPLLMEALGDVKQVAGTDSTVLITGETGTGKELFARAIHANSIRSEKPLIKVNCASIPAPLIESELFGHKKGAFTGAISDRQGRFELAEDGTIFLDEIGELTLDLQAKLLRVLQEGEFEPVGSSVTRKVNIRVIAATNRDLLKMVHEGRFRSDLYYRLNVFPIHIPPLRDRGNDTVLIASAFKTKFANTMGKEISEISQKEANNLFSYSWPGNVRELQNVIERAVITSRNGRLNLERAIPAPGDIPGASKTEAEFQDYENIRTESDIRNLERTNMIRALKMCNWQVAGEKGAAKLLGLPPTTFASRMKSLNIKRS